MLAVPHGALDEHHVHVLRELLDVGDGGKHELGALGELQKPLVQVQKGHVATGAPREPHGSHAQQSTGPPFLDLREDLRLFPLLACGLALLEEGAGGAGLHAFPTAGTGLGLPQGSPRSASTRVKIPRPEKPQVAAPSTSAQARTHRPQRTQRLWSIPYLAWLRSTKNGSQR